MSAESSGGNVEVPVDIVHGKSAFAGRGPSRDRTTWMGSASVGFHGCWENVMRIGIAFAAGIAAIVLGFAGAAEAETHQQNLWCEGKDNATPDAQVTACTALIQSGKYTGHNLAIVFNNRCSAYFDKGSYDLAMKDCDRAIKIDSGYAKPYYNRSLIWYKKEDYDRTIKDSDVVIKLDPSYAEAYDTRANAYSDKGDHQRAIRDYNESIRIKPKNPITLANRCDELVIIGQFKAARDDCDESLRIRPNHAHTLKHRAMASMALGDLDNAMSDYANVLRQSPKDAEALYGRGMIKFRKGDVAGGTEDMTSGKAVTEDIAATFAKYGLKADAETAPASPAQPASARPNDCAGAETHWKSVEEIKTLAAYQDHLARFPNCAFATLAAARIEALKKQ